MGLFDFLRKPKMPATMEAAMVSQAQDFIDAFLDLQAPIDARQLNYSRDSIALVDKVLQDFYAQQAPLPEDLHFLASAYVFECARRQYGGRYLRGDEPNPFVLVIGEPDFQIGFCAMEKVASRAANGPEDSLVFFYDGIAEPYQRKVSTTLT